MFKTENAKIVNTATFNTGVKVKGGSAPVAVRVGGNGIFRVKVTSSKINNKDLMN